MSVSFILLKNYFGVFYLFDVAISLNSSCNMWFASNLEIWTRLIIFFNETSQQHHSTQMQAITRQKNNDIRSNNTLDDWMSKKNNWHVAFCHKGLCDSRNIYLGLILYLYFAYFFSKIPNKVCFLALEADSKSFDDHIVFQLVWEAFKPFYYCIQTNAQCSGGKRSKSKRFRNQNPIDKIWLKLIKFDKK